jgi:hypothetical protein
VTTRALTASASRYVNRKVRAVKAATDQGWQTRAWQLYHAVPEVRFAATYMANGMAGATLYAGRRADDGTIEPAPDNHRASEIVQQIAGGPDGQAKMLGAFGKHLTVPGEGWIVVRPNGEVLSPDVPEDGHDWRVLSTREVSQKSGKLTAEIDGDDVEIPPGDEETLDPDSPVALRVWEPDPERAIEADSPVRASIDLLEELLLLNAAVKAIARSRLTGRGILLVPKGTRFPTRPGQGDAEDDLIEVLMMIAETAIREPESAAATVPIVLEVPADSIADFKLLTFESNFDELALKLREEAIKRFATGLEIPGELLLGMGDTNHWGAWMLTSEAIRMGIEPKLQTVCQALTQQWLRPSSRPRTSRTGTAGSSGTTQPDSACAPTARRPPCRRTTEASSAPKPCAARPASRSPTPPPRRSGTPAQGSPSMTSNRTRARARTRTRLARSPTSRSTRHRKNPTPCLPPAAPRPTPDSSLPQTA